MSALYSTAYFGPISYFADMLRCREVLIDGTESWQKQTYRNRCYIDSPGGVLMLNIPVVHQTNKGKIFDLEISYAENWPIKHWQALQTTYGSSPFFEILGPGIKDILYRREKRLLELNSMLLDYCLFYLEADVYPSILKSEDELVMGFKDQRQTYHPKKEVSTNFMAYPQVFDNKKDFVPNLSIIDLLFNEGPAAFDYLTMH